MISKLKIGQKLALVFGILLALLVLVAGFAWCGLSQLSHAYTEVAARDQQALFQLAKEVDHLVWVNDLINVLLLDREFSGQLDHRHCDFGRWYYDFAQSPEYQKESSEYRRVFSAIEAPHQALHDSAIAD